MRRLLHLSVLATRRRATPRNGSSGEHKPKMDAYAWECLHKYAQVQVVSDPQLTCCVRVLSPNTHQHHQPITRYKNLWARRDPLRIAWEKRDQHGALVVNCLRCRSHLMGPSTAWLRDSVCAATLNMLRLTPPAIIHLQDATEVSRSAACFAGA